METPVALAAAPASAAPFPSMRGMAPTPAAHAEEHFVPMRGMAAIAPARPEPRHAVLRVSPFVADTASSAPSGESRYASGKEPWRAIFLSLLFPGGGQFYNGDVKKGFTLVGIAILAYCLLLAGAWIVSVPLSLGSWVWAFLDAGKVARREKALW